ncbi:MAG: transketolase [Chloroflexota bacterium]
MEYLVKLSREIRRLTFEMVLRAGRGHLGGSFSCLEILVALYAGEIMRHDPKNPTWEKRDRFLLSKGHANNTLYVLLAYLGYYSMSELDTFMTDGSLLGMHLDQRLPGIETVSGSLGHGLGLGAGLALAAKLDEKDYLTFVLLGDGESQEGSVWEAGMFASTHQLNNLIAITDRNRLGSEDFTENTAGLDPLEERWRTFGWEVVSINGHNFEEILNAFEGVRIRKSPKPLMVISNSIKAKGISSLENTPHAHHTLPKGQDIEMARVELQ